MKKIFILFAIAFGVVALQSCNSCSKEDIKDVQVEFVYDVLATAKGEGRFAWEALPHVGDIVIDGKLEVAATNDTAAVKMFNAAVVANAPKLSEAICSENVEMAAAAKEVASKLHTTHLSGKYQLDATGYVKYGPFYFAIDEHYPSAN